MGNKNTVIKIEEYRSHLGIDHVLVTWGDKTSSWERLESVCCKGLMLNFIKSGISYLRKKEETEILEEQKKKETAMLQKLIDQNKKFEMKVPRWQEAPIVENKPLPAPEAMASVRPPFRMSVSDVVQPEPVKHRVQDNWGGELTQSPAPGGTANRISKSNVFSIYNSDVKICNLLFHYKKDAPEESIDISQMYFPPISKVAARIHSLYHQDGGGDSLRIYYGGVTPNSEASEWTTFRSTVLSSDSVAIYMSEDACWVFDFSFKLSAMLGLPQWGGVFIMKVENDYYLSRLVRFKDTLQRSVLWDENKYAASVHRLVGHLFSGVTFPFQLSGVFVGDSRSAAGKYTAILVKNGPGLSQTDGNSIVIQDGYLEYIHQAMPSFESLPLLKSRFFMVQDFHISEVLKSGGIFTISNRLMANCDVLTISGFLARVADLEGWSVYVPSFVYNCFKQKVIKMPAGYKDNESLKKAYNLLKHGCLEAQQLDYLSQLRNMFWKDNRYFYLIDTEGNTENSISISQAIRIVGT